MNVRFGAACAAGFSLNLLCAALLQIGAGTVLSLAPMSTAQAQAVIPGCEVDDEPEDEYDGDECLPPNVPLNTPKSLGEQCSADISQGTQLGLQCGDPINLTTGSVFEREVDYMGGGPFPLKLVRVYESLAGFSGVFGANWTFTFGPRIQQVTSTQVNVVSDSHKTLTFNLVGGLWVPDGDVNSRLTKTSSGWSYTTGLDGREDFDLTGRLLAVSNRAGVTQTVSYNTSGQVSVVSDAFGRSLQFSYDGSGRIIKVTTPSAATIIYTYDAINNLTSVTNRDGTKRYYLYENSAFPHALTGLIDENAVRASTWVYDSNGIAISTQRAGGVEAMSVTYDHTAQTTTVTDALGNPTQYRYVTVLGVAHTLQRAYGFEQNYGFNWYNLWVTDPNGNVDLFIDSNTNGIGYAHNMRNLETRRTNSQNEEITTKWHATFRLPIQITRDQKITDFTYDTAGNLIQRNITSGPQVRTWEYLYNSNGQVTQATGPLQEVTNFAYDNQGNLSTVTDAGGHITKYTSYNADGLPLSSLSPNQIQTNFQYDPRGRLLTITTLSPGGMFAPEITRYGYDAAGQLTKITLPDGSVYNLQYDPARRLQNIADPLGNKVVYTRDLMSNIVKREYFDAQGNRTQTATATYDLLNRLFSRIGAQGQETQYYRDGEDNLGYVVAPSGLYDVLTYDVANRLVGWTDRSGYSSVFRYDQRDNFTGVTDQRGLSTSYWLDWLDNVTSLISSDTGRSDRTYDAAGNVQSTTDSRGFLATTTFDSLSRPLQNVVSGNGAPSRTFTWTYDQTGSDFGLGVGCHFPP